MKLWRKFLNLFRRPRITNPAFYAFMQEIEK